MYRVVVDELGVVVNLVVVVDFGVDVNMSVVVLVFAGVVRPCGVVTLGVVTLGVVVLGVT